MRASQCVLHTPSNATQQSFTPRYHVHSNAHRISQQRCLLEEVSKAKNFSKHHDWYGLHTSDIFATGNELLRATLHAHSNSLHQLLSAVYPEQEWHPWLFSSSYLPLSYWIDLNNQRNFMLWLGTKLSYKSLEDWYSVTARDVISNGGLQLLNLKGGNCSTLVMSTLQHDNNWLPWRFASLPANFWKRTKNQRKFLDWAVVELGLSDYSSFYSLVPSQLKSLCSGSDILSQYNNSVYELVVDAVPEYQWDKKLFGIKTASNAIPASLLAHQKFCDSFASKFGIKYPSDWYHVTEDQLREQPGGIAVLTEYNNVLNRLLRAVYPHYTWDSTQFVSGPRGFWTHMNNRRDFVENVAQKIGIKQLDDWYNVTIADFRKHQRADSVLDYYGNSLATLLRHVYPTHNWMPWKFKAVSRGCWDDDKNIRAFVNWYEKEKGISSPIDWYRITYRDVAMSGGRMILERFKGLYGFLKHIYPNYEWKPWLLNHVPKDYWMNTAHVKQFIKYCEMKLMIKETADWEKIPLLEFRKLGASSLLSTYGNIWNVLKISYPDYPWPETTTNYRAVNSQGQKSQQYLTHMISRILPPHTTVYTNFLHPQLIAANTNRIMELDVYVPTFGLAFEYQGEHHYKHHGMFGDPSFFEECDENKKKQCEDIGITLIHIPYWWDKQIGSLAATVHAHRPDVVTEKPSSTPIPTALPSKMSYGRSLSPASSV